MRTTTLSLRLRSEVGVGSKLVIARVLVRSGAQDEPAPYHGARSKDQDEGLLLIKQTQAPTSGDTHTDPLQTSQAMASTTNTVRASKAARAVFVVKAIACKIWSGFM